MTDIRSSTEEHYVVPLLPSNVLIYRDQVFDAVFRTADVRTSQATFFRNK
jgi:hypothetical protein